MIRIEVNHNDLDYVRRRLGGLGSQAPKALKEAVNITAQRTRRMLETKVRQRYTAKYAGLNSHMRITRATASRLYAVIKVNGNPLTQPRFRISPKDSVSTEVIRGSGLKELVNSAGNKAFMGTSKAGKMVYQRKGKSRFPLHAFHGPGIAKMFEKVYGGRGIDSAGLKAEIERMYRQNVEAAIERTLNGK